MASEFDELIQSLEHELALAGKHGLSFDEIKALSLKFFAPRNALAQDTTVLDSQSLLFTDEPPRSKTIVDLKLVESVWNRLLGLDGVKVEKVTSTATIEPISLNDEDSSSAPSHPDERLVASVERLWQAVAGHGVDNVRVSAMEFALLHIIAKHGADGIIQPDLVRESGQDKRSVPKRTDALVEGGYIIKRPVIASATKTSFLKLKRDEVGQDLNDSDPDPAPGGIAFYDKWYTDLIKLLNAQNGVIATADIKAEFGIKPATLEVRTLNRCIRRLVAAGLIRRINAQVAGKSKKDKGARAKSIQLMRQPTDVDRQLFMQKVDNAHTTDVLGEDGDESDGENALIPHDNEDAPLVAQWTPDMIIGNFIYAMVDEAGATGISIMELHRRGFGLAWRRPVDETLIRLCDAWKHSQPSHLRHLALIKDTAHHGKMTHFVYRTFGAYSEAVASGDADWAKVQSKAEDTGVRHNQPVDFVQRPIVETQLDSWGFPVILQDLLAGDGDGTATLAECSRDVKELAASLDETIEVQRTSNRAKKLMPTKPVDQTTTATLNRKRSPEIESEDNEPSKRPKLAESSTQLSIASEEQILVEDRDGTASQVLHIPGDSAEQPNDESSQTPVELARVRINPPGAREMKLFIRPAKGRPRKTLIAVFRLPGLQQLDWFVEDSPNLLNSFWRPTPKYLKRKRDAPATDTTASLHRLEPQQSAGASLGSPIRDDGIKESQQSPSVQTMALGPAKYTKKGGITRHHGSANVKRTQIILAIIRKCGGLYPGNREIYPSMLSALKDEQTTRIDFATINNTINDLIRRGSLRRIFFHFYDTNGNRHDKSILAEPSIGPNDPEIEEMKANIKKHHPDRYRPDEEIMSDKQPAHASATNDPSTTQGSAVTPAKAASTGEAASEEQVTVTRTTAGLQADEAYRQELYRKNDAIRPIKRRRLQATKHIVDRDVEASDDDSDGEIEEPSPEQASMMDSLQVEHYQHNISHAFPTVKPRIRFPHTLRFKTLPTGHVLGTFLRREPEVNTEPLAYSLGSGDYQQILPAAPPDAQPDGPRILRSASNGEHSKDDSSSTIQAPQGVTFAWQTNMQSLAPVSEIGQRYFPKLPDATSTLSNQRFSQTPSSHVAILDMRQASKTAGQMLGRLRVNKPSYNSLRGHRHALGLDKTASPTRDSTSRVRVLADSPEVITPKKRDRRGTQMFNENEKLVCGVALYRTVLGGVDQRNNWGVIAHMFNFRYEPDFLRRRWDVMKNAQETTVQTIADLIQESFLTAYSDGKVPAIDFENLNKTDWAAMLQWVDQIMTRPDAGTKRNVSDLPQSLDHLHDSFAISKQTLFWEYSKESWFTSPVEKTRKDIAHEFVFGVALPGHSRPFAETDPSHIVLNTLIRAIAATSGNNYIPRRAWQKLDAFDPDLVALVKDDMVNDKTLRHINKGRVKPGRNFEIHDSTWACFRRWPGKTNEWTYLREVASARAKIIHHLAEYDEWSLQIHSTDAEIVVLLNMLSQGLITITTQLPERNDDFEAPFPKLSALGYNGYTYNAKTLDRARLRFPVAFEKTESFTADDGLIRDVPVPLTPPSGLDDGRVPFWIDIHGKLLPTIWDLVLRSVLHLLVFRIGCTARHIEESHNHKILVWEIEILLQWMEESGLAVRSGPGQERDGLWTGGWAASEWWYCAFMPEMTTWR